MLLGNLSELTSLNLYQNALTGSIPQLTGFSKLVTLILGGNGFTGTIGSLTTLQQLETFEIRGAQLTGSTPDISGLAKLKTFMIDGNKLNGQIGPLTGAAALEIFRASNNQLTGQIPASLSTLGALRFLHINNNQLVGSPPPVPNNILTAAMCPNPLRNSPDAAINAAWNPRTGNGNNPWATGCTGSWDVTPTVRDAASGQIIIDGRSGTITPSTMQILPRGGGAVFTLAPAASYRLPTQLDTNCPGTLSGNTYTVANVQANCYVNVAFVREVAGPSDGVCGSDHGQTLSAPPVNLCAAGAPSALTGTGPWGWSCAATGAGGAPAQCTAQLAGAGGSLTVRALVTGVGGTAAPASQSVLSGARATITATPDSGYRLASASGCGGTTIAGNTVITAPVTASCDVTLNFAIAQPGSFGVQPVPTLGEWALALLAALMLLVGLRMRRGRH